MKRVAILGCGPAGLLAAHAAHIMRLDAKVFALKTPSVINGAQFLHEEIPQLDCGVSRPITLSKIGDAEGYALKVYGDVGAECSFDLLADGEIPAWPMIPIYKLLWDLYSDMVKDVRLYHQDIRALQEEYDLVISTIPRTALCRLWERGRGLHKFDAQEVAFANRAMYRMTEQDYIVYNGSPESEWYRCSRIWGVESTEYSSRSISMEQEQVRGLTHGYKPLETNCNCHPGVLYIGRFGKWQKGVLVHHAFQEAAHALQSL